MIIEGTIINPVQVVYATQEEGVINIVTTAIGPRIWGKDEAITLESEALEFADPDGDIFAALAKEIERLSPPRPI